MFVIFFRSYYKCSNFLLEIVFKILYNFKL